MARLLLSALGLRRASAVASLGLACLSGCSGDIVNLGSSGTMLAGGGVGGGAGTGGATTQGGIPSVLEWSSPQLLLTQPKDTLSFANGTLTSQAAQIYFTEQTRGAPETRLAHAGRVGDDWGPRSPLSVDAFDAEDASSPAISLHGDRLWFGSRMDGSASTDIWVSSGSGDTWSKPEKETDVLNSEFEDVPRQPAVADTIMPLSSKRESKHYQIWFATRQAANLPWQAVTQDMLGSLNSPDYESADAFLTRDGLTLFFSSTRDGSADLFRAQRASIQESFGQPAALTGVNNPMYDDRDPWLDEDNQQLYFSSNRSGLYELYSAEHVP